MISSRAIKPAPVGEDTGEYRRRVDILDDFDKTSTAEKQKKEDGFGAELERSIDRDITNFNSHTNPGMFHGVGAVGRNEKRSDLPWLCHKMNGRSYTDEQWAALGEAV